MWGYDEQDALEKAKGDSKKLWKIIRLLVGNKKRKNNTFSLNGKTTTPLVVIERRRVLKRLSRIEFLHANILAKRKPIAM